MRILGIDPGLAHIGYGLIEVTAGVATAEDFGQIVTRAGLHQQERLGLIATDMGQLLSSLKPDLVAFERVVTIQMGNQGHAVQQAIGVILLALEDAGLRAVPYSSSEWKAGVVGRGAATKREVQYAVKDRLDLPDIPKPDHAADALAIALYHWGRYDMEVA